MVKSNGNSKPRLADVDRLARALRRRGVDEDTVQAAIQEATEPIPITLAEASEKFGILYGTLISWVRRGHLREIGRLRFPARRGGKVLIDERELVALLANPPKPGRPPKTSQPS